MPRQATIRQKQFVKNLLDDVGNNKATTLRSIAIRSGYKQISKYPARIMKSKGVLELFAKAGINPERIAMNFNEVLDLPLNEKSISIKNKLNLLKILSNYVIDSPSARLTPQVNFLQRFYNLSMLGQNAPRDHKEIKEKEKKEIKEKEK